MIENKREQKGWHMRKEILPEMFNYNKYPGPDFVYVADLLKSDACQFTVLENHKDALDATRFGQRFSEIMLKYDYIVGDWSNDQLRLKGFYEDERPNTRKTDRISRLSEYLREYCAFGCAYFILKNEEPQLIVFEEETEPRRKRRRSNNRRNASQESKERNASQKNKGQKASAKQKPDKSKRRDRDQEGLRKSSVVLSSNLDLRMVVVSVSLTSRRVRSKLQILKVKTLHRRNKARPSQMVSISQSEKKEIKLCQK